MPATPDELFASLDRLGIAHPTVSHPPLFTVEQSQALRGTIPGGHTKNLFLKDKKGALYPGDRAGGRRDRAEIAAPAARRRRPLLVRLGRPAARDARRRARRGDAVRRASTTRAGRVTVVLDAALMAHATINAHPLVNTMTTSIARDDLVKFLRGDRPRAADRAGLRSRPAAA